MKREKQQEDEKEKSICVKLCAQVHFILNHNAMHFEIFICAVTPLHTLKHSQVDAASDEYGSAMRSEQLKWTVILIIFYYYDDDDDEKQHTKNDDEKKKKQKTIGCISYESHY